MKRFRYILYIVLAAVLCGCVREQWEQQEEVQLKDGDPVTINGSIELPLTNDGIWGTKAFTEIPQVKALYVAVFNSGDILYEVVKANPGTYSHPRTQFTPSSEGEKYLTEFNVTLSTVLQGDRYVHFIACSEEIPSLEGGGTNMVDEGTFVHDLVTSNAVVAYWARKHYTFITNSTPMKNIPMVRNFAKVQVEVEPSVTNFELLGFKVFNTPKYGTITPFNNNTKDYITISGQTMINFDRFADFTSLEGQANPYTFLTSTQEYYGFMPPEIIYDDLSTLSPGYNSGGGTDLSFVNSNFIGYAGGTHESENADYLYECSYRADANPFIILYANYKDGSTWKKYFYKADFVFYDETIAGNKYYNILRNFLYRLNISGVNGPGSSTIYDAVNGIALNNFDASVESQPLTNVADDDYHLYVSSTDILVTSGTSFTMYVKSEKISTPKANDNANISALVREATSGSLIVANESKISIAGSDETSGIWQGWRKVTITCSNPDNLQRGEVWKQPIVFKNTHGLTRIVNLTLRRPFSLTVDAQDFVTPSAGEECYVDFSIPAGLTFARFPMYFYIEQEDNTLYPKALASGDLATLSVESGPTNIPGNSGNNYYYRRTITWTEYDAAQADINGIKTFRSWFKSLVDESATTVWVVPAAENDYYYPVDGGDYTNQDSFANSMATGNVHFQYYGMQLNVGGKDTNIATANSGAPITYSSNNPAVATVNSAGLVTAVSTGSATITASCDAYKNYTGASDSYVVNVTSASLSHLAVAWDYEPVRVVKVGSTVTTVGNYTTAPGYGGSVTTVYESTNTGVATVNSAGAVTGVAAGTATIKYTANAAASGGYAAASQSVSYTITVVTDHPESGTVYHSETFMDPTRFFSDSRFGDYTIASETVQNASGTNVTTEFHNWTTFNAGPSYEQRHVWYHYYNTKTGVGYGAAASGYGAIEAPTEYAEGGEYKTDYHNQMYTSSTRLVSKSIDLSCSAGATLIFYHAGNYFYSKANMQNDAKVRFSADGGSSWSDPVTLNYPDGSNWLYVKAQADIPAAYLTANFRIAFDYSSIAETFSQATNSSSQALYYVATSHKGNTIANRSETTTTPTAFPVMVSDGDGRAGTWEIKNLVITEN